MESAGSGVNNFKAGDRVTVDPIIWCNRCPACLNGQNNVCQNLKLLGIEYDGGFADYVVAEADKVFKVPDSVSLRDAALIELYSLGVHSARKAQIEPGDRVVILGAGRLGLAVLEVIKQTAAAWVCTVDVIDSRLNIAEKMGADNFWHSLGGNCYFGDRNGGCIGSQNGVGGAYLVQPCENVPLDFPVFDHGFEYEIRLVSRLQSGGQFDAAHDFVNRSLNTSLFHEFAH